MKRPIKLPLQKTYLTKPLKPKETLQMLEQQSISIETITPIPVVNEMLDSSLKPRKKKENKHPFSVKSDEIKVLRQ